MYMYMYILVLYNIGVHVQFINYCCFPSTASRAIELQGGYQFDISAVPNTFFFGEGQSHNSNSFGGQP